MTADQQDLIDFVNDPENIKKAAEGSMDKRNALIDRVTADTTDEALRDKLDSILMHFCELAAVGDPEKELNRGTDQLLDLIHSREQEIFRRVQTEVIGGDYPSGEHLGISAKNELLYRNDMLARQTTALATIKGNGDK